MRYLLFILLYLFAELVLARGGYVRPCNGGFLCSFIEVAGELLTVSMLFGLLVYAIRHAKVTIKFILYLAITYGIPFVIVIGSEDKAAALVIAIVFLFVSGKLFSWLIDDKGTDKK